MTVQNTWLNRFPRLNELYERMAQLEPGNVLAGYIRLGEFDSFVREDAEWHEGNLVQLDPDSWEELKRKVLPYSCKKQENRGWQQFYDLLNECRGYVLLASRGYSKICFIPHGGGEAPDLRGESQNSRAFVEVKTINRSDLDLKRHDPVFLARINNRPGDIKELPVLAKKLSQRVDPVSTFLWERLDEPGKKLLTNANEASSKEDVERIERILVAVLNDVMQGECIFDKERFQGVPLRPLTRGFLKEMMVGSLKDNPVGKDSMFLNRWLLEDAYPNELEKLPSLVADLRPNQPMPAKFKEKLENVVRKARSQLEKHAILSDKKIVLLIINRDLSCMALRIKEIEGAFQQADLEVVCQIGYM